MATKISVTASKTESYPARTFVTTHDFGSDIHEALEKYGEDSVYNHFVASAKLSANSFIRGKMTDVNEGSTAEVPAWVNDDDAIQAELAAWELPDKKERTAGDPAEQIKKMLEKMTPESREAFLASLPQLAEG